MKIRILAVICFLFLMVSVKADDYQDAFKVYKEYLSATMAKNLRVVMDRLDKTSPTYNTEIKNVAEAMINSDITFKIISAEFVGKTDEYIIIRVSQQNIPKNTDSKTKGIEVDALQIFKKDASGKWKYRNAQILSFLKIK